MKMILLPLCTSRESVARLFSIQNRCLTIYKTVLNDHATNWLIFENYPNFFKLINWYYLPRKRIPIFVIFVINSESNFVFPRRNEFNKFNLELLFVDFLQSMPLFCLCQFRLVRTWCIFNIFKNMFLSLSHNDKREHIESKFSLYEQTSMKQLSKYMI